MVQQIKKQSILVALGAIAFLLFLIYVSPLKRNKWIGPGNDGVPNWINYIWEVAKGER